MTNFEHGNPYMSERGTEDYKEAFAEQNTENYPTYIAGFR